MNDCQSVQGVDVENIDMIGSGVEIVGYDEGLRKTYRTNQIAFKGLNTGTVTVTAKGRGTGQFGAVKDGVVDLSINQTITIISDSMIEAFAFETSTSAPYKVSIFQSDHRRGGL